MYGFGLNHSTNHFGNIYDKLKNGNQVELFTDQYRSPIELSDAARLIGKLIESGVNNETLNFGGPERLSRFEMGRKLCLAAGFDENLLIPKLMSESGIPYQVRDVSLDITKLLSIGLAPQNIDESLKRILDEK
jgi:dTDP-4-dehydrorhamnose reductase